MAKSKSSKIVIPSIPANVQGTVALTKEDLGNMGVGDDLVKVGISRARKKLQSQLSDLQDRITEAENGIKEDMKAAEATARECAEKETAAASETAPSFFQTLGYKGVKSKIDRVILDGCRNYSEDKLVFEKFSFHFVVEAKDAGSAGSVVDHYMQVKCPKKLRDQLEAAESAREAVRTMKNQAMELKRKIANLPAYREDLEAMLAETRLANNETGAAVLAKLEAQLEDDLKLLPSN